MTRPLAALVDPYAKSVSASRPPLRREEPCHLVGTPDAGLIRWVDYPANGTRLASATASTNPFAQDGPGAS
jgi:hypothetical protein